jgi:hypothetical protein
MTRDAATPPGIQGGVFLALTILAAALGCGRVALAEPDRIRLAETYRLADRIRPVVWPGWERTPMAVLLVTDSLEYLIGHPRPSPEFSSLGRDSRLGREVLARPRQLAPTLLATFPAVGGLPTIVVGTAERTGKSSVEWVLTLLHEHFHQWQSSLPDYYARANGLGLARGDSTGRWMLEYAFPYDSAPVQRAVEELAGSVGRALAHRDGAEATAAVWRRLDTLRQMLSADDYRYLEFQLWQEGVPRFIELAAAEAAVEAGRPADGFLRLPDHEPYAELATRLRRELERSLAELTLRRDRRVAFYPLGAGLAALCERSRGDWKGSYALELFSTPRCHP